MPQFPLRSKGQELEATSTQPGFATLNRRVNPPLARSVTHSLTVLPDGADELVLRLPQLLHDVLVERVHVLHQPLAGGVVDAARVVQHGEVGLAAEVRLGELRARGARVQVQNGRTTLHCDHRVKLCEGVSLV